MHWLEAAGLGALQGLTEFLPVSSSGHLSILEYFLGLEETPRFFDLMLHVGTLLAVLLFYGARSSSFIRRNESGNSMPLRRVIAIAFYVCLATVPAVLYYIVFRPTELADGQSLADVSRDWRQWVGDLREHSSRQPEWVLTFMTITGFVLVAGSQSTAGKVDASRMRWWHALIIGIAQALSAMCPGLSRSGMTVSTGLLLGLRGDWAVHFSLLLSIPTIVGGALVKAKDADPEWISANVFPTVVGTLVSAVVGWFCITLLLRAVQRGRWWWFAIYVWFFVAIAGGSFLLNRWNPASV